MPLFPSPRDLPGCTLLAFPREIDLLNAEFLFLGTMDVVDARRGRLRRLVLDLTGTDFMDSQGVRVISDVRGRLPRSSELRVAARPDGAAVRVLELTGLRRDVPVYDCLAEAVAA
ncbi:STAS domain-containing protein [Streptomyces fructofermentans]|uniref:Anti-sigma factor antagonist n=1 Tax=Streptomyces fructofermentans TaxID=152141 RepID=A0A918U0L3_9ACTN|nr:STAS domain-containing protein [Streptomyces fructofermentans]GGX79434.1 anti-sigma factor antagonist [Streptomyces fructofermentans]